MESSLATAAPGAAPPTAHTLQFSGSGSEYFRIWIVNLLLTLVTLGVYHPWAKVRKLRYFYGNTRLAGHAFDFHGEPTRMLRGYLLVGALFALYAFAGRVSPTAGLVALVIVALVWPALLRTSMRFRLSQTSWRGLRFGFAGSTAGAYKALLPGFAALALMLGASLLLPTAPAADEATAGAAQAAAVAPPSALAAGLFFGSLALLLVSMPWTWWLLKRYQHDHYTYAGSRTRWHGTVGSFYAIGLKAAGLFVLWVLAMVALVWLVIWRDGPETQPGPLQAMLPVVVMLGSYALWLFVLQPYLVSRVQNLVWNGTASRLFGFGSALRFGPLARLSATNALLIVLTLGLYWPFAAVAMARMRLAAVQVLTREGLDALVGSTRSPTNAPTRDASGDAAGDLFGIDIGL